MILDLKFGIIAMLLFSACCIAQVTTTTNCTINGTGSNTASADCTSSSVDQGAQAKANNEAGEKLGQGIGGLIGIGIRNHEVKKGIKQYCRAHPGEPYQWKLPDGTITSDGTCEGTVSLARARELLTKNVCSEAIKEGKACYVAVQGDVMTVHSERASSVRYHMAMSNGQFVPHLKQADIKTYIYTNDADQTFTYDVATGRDIPMDQAKK